MMYRTTLMRHSYIWYMHKYSIFNYAASAPCPVCPATISLWSTLERIDGDWGRITKLRMQSIFLKMRTKLKTTLITIFISESTFFSGCKKWHKNIKTNHNVCDKKQNLRWEFGQNITNVFTCLKTEVAGKVLPKTWAKLTIAKDAVQSSNFSTF